MAALLDEGTLQLISAADDSGMLAAVGQVEGTRVVAFCSDATVMGGAMGDVGCRVIVDAHHLAMTDGIPIIGLWHSGGARRAEGHPLRHRARDRRCRPVRRSATGNARQHPALRCSGP